MNDPKFTPGPWRTDCRLIGGQIRITQVPNANMTVAQVNGRQGEQEANARLIAAAPEMLEALEVALGDIDTMEAAISGDASSYDAAGLLNTFGHMRRSMSAAIAKAKGETE